MGICDSLFNNSSPPSNSTSKNGKKEPELYQKLPINNNQQFSNNKKRGNYFRSQIGEPNNFQNMDISQSMTTVGNNSFYPPKQVKPFTYVNTYKQSGNLQRSLATGSLHGTNNYSSIMTGNKGDSRLSDNNMSTSKSFGEFIVEGEINQNMEGDKDFNNFMDMNKDSFIDNGNNLDGDIKKNINKNKKDFNYYIKKNPKNINNNNNLKVIKERNKEEESSENQQPPMPLDTIE